MTFTAKQLYPDGRAATIEPPYDGWEDEMHFEVVEQREILLEQLPPSGVVHNVDEIATYLHERGMTFAPYRVVDGQSPDSKEVLAAYGISFENKRSITGSYATRAHYSASLGLILLARPPRYDSRQPESSLVFCNANAYGLTEHDVYLDEAGEEIYREIVQRGFKSRNAEGKAQGGLAERSFSSLIAADYRKNVHDNRGLGYPTDSPLRVRGVGYVHPKYRQQGSVDVNVLGSVGLEVLCAHDPGLAPAILEARRSKKAIDTMLARMEAISPGLGKQMLQESSTGWERWKPYEGGTFLRHALQATGTSARDITDISEEAPLSRHFAALIAEDSTRADIEESTARERIEVRPGAPGDDPLTRIINEVTGTLDGTVSGANPGLHEDNQTEQD